MGHLMLIDPFMLSTKEPTQRTKKLQFTICMRTTSAASRARVITKNETMESDSDNSGSSLQSYADYYRLPASARCYTRRFEQGLLVDTVEAVKDFYRPCSQKS